MAQKKAFRIKKTSAKAAREDFVDRRVTSRRMRSDCERQSRVWHRSSWVGVKRAGVEDSLTKIETVHQPLKFHWCNKQIRTLDSSIEVLIQCGNDSTALRSESILLLYLLLSKGALLLPLQQ